MTVKVTSEYLDAHRTERGAWTLLQIVALGVKWPPPPGWRKEIDGKELTDDQARAFESAKTAFSAKTLRQQKRRSAEISGEIMQAVKSPPSATLSAKAAKKARQKVIKANKRAARVAALQVKLAASKINKPAAWAPRIDPNTPDFLSSYDWRRLRMMALQKYGRRCMCCGASPDTGAVMHVDHIKPRRLFPQLALELDNLQVLCHECNHGKGNWDHTDWRQDVEDIDPETAAFIRSIAKAS